MSKSFVTDEGHWITINGNHVLINEKGEVLGGMGGKFNGRRISKFNTKVPSAQELKNKSDALSAKAGQLKADALNARQKYDEEHNVERDIVNGKVTLARGKKAIEKALKERDAYRDKRNKESGAEEMDREARKASNISYRIRRGLTNAEGKNGRFRNLTAEKVRLQKEGEADKARTEKRVEALNKKIDETRSKYNNAAARIQKSSEGLTGRRQWSRENLASNVEQRGNALAGVLMGKRDAVRSRYSHRKDLRFEKEDELDTKIPALRKTLANTRAKLANAAEANKFIASTKGTRVSPLTSGMTGGKFRTNEQKVNEAISKHSPKMKAAMEGMKKLDEKAANTEAKYYKAFNRLSKAGKSELGHDLLERHDKKQEDIKRQRGRELRKYNIALGKEMDEINKATLTTRAAKSTLAQARPRIAERRQAVANYNAKTSRAWLAKNAAKADSGKMSRAEMLEWNRHVRNVSKADPKQYEFTEFTTQNGKPLE